MREPAFKMREPAFKMRKPASQIITTPLQGALSIGTSS